MKQVWFFLFLGVSLCTSPAIAEVVVGTIPADNPRALAINPRTNLIYAVDGRGANGPLLVIDAVTAQTIASIPVGFGPIAVAVNPLTSRIYVVNELGGSISVIDGKTNQLETTISSGRAAPTGIAVDARRNLVYVLNDNVMPPNSVTVLDGNTNEIVASIPFAPADCSDPFGIAINEKTDRIYVACPGLPHLIVVDGKTRTALGVDIGTLSIGFGSAPLAVNPRTNLIYLAGQGPQGCAGSGLFFCVILRVVDGRTNSVVQSFEMGLENGGFQAVAVNPRTDRVYVVDSSRPTLTVLDAKNNVIVGTLPVGNFPFAIAVNTKTNLIYVANAQDNTLSVIAGPHAHQ